MGREKGKVQVGNKMSRFWLKKLLSASPKEQQAFASASMWKDFRFSAVLVHRGIPIPDPTLAVLSLTGTLKEAANSMYVIL